MPNLRVNAESPTFGEIVLFCYQKSTTSNCYLMDFSETPLRGAEIWHIWKQHFQIEAFWKILKSILKIKEMRLHGDGIYTGLLIKVLAYPLVGRTSITAALWGLNQVPAGQLNPQPGICQRYFALMIPDFITISSCLSRKLNPMRPAMTPKPTAGKMLLLNTANMHLIKKSKKIDRLLAVLISFIF